MNAEKLKGLLEDLCETHIHNNCCCGDQENADAVCPTMTAIKAVEAIATSALPKAIENAVIIQVEGGVAEVDCGNPSTQIVLIDWDNLKGRA